MNKKEQKQIFFNPTELLDRNPQLKEYWQRPQELGYLLALKLVSGYKTARSCQISEPDILKLYNFLKVSE